MNISKNTIGRLLIGNYFALDKNAKIEKFGQILKKSMEQEEPEKDQYGFCKITADDLKFSHTLLSKILKPEAIEPIIWIITQCGHYTPKSQCTRHLKDKWLELRDTEQFPDYTIRECLEYLELNQEAIVVLEPHITEVKKVYPTVRRYFYDVWNNLCNNSDEAAAGSDYFEFDDKYGIWSMRQYKYDKDPDPDSYIEKYYW